MPPMLRKRGLRTEASGSAPLPAPCGMPGLSLRGRGSGEAEAPSFGTGRTWIQTWTWNAARCHGDLKGRGWSQAAQFNIFKCQGQKQRSVGLFLESVGGGLPFCLLVMCPGEGEEFS